MIINIPKGTKDILPSESYKWQWLESRIRETAAKYGFKEIRTPMFEHTELFARGIGDTTDVVQKEMYTFEIAERSLTLKPEGTAGVVRSYIENKLYAEPQPGKYFYIIPCFRYEKMQKGRQRQFHQFGIEIFGSENMMADAEVIGLAWDFLTGLGITDLKLHINSYPAACAFFSNKLCHLINRAVGLLICGIICLAVFSFKQYCKYRRRSISGIKIIPLCFALCM